MWWSVVTVVAESATCVVRTGSWLGKLWVQLGTAGLVRSVLFERRKDGLFSSC